MNPKDAIVAINIALPRTSGHVWLTAHRNPDSRRRRPRLLTARRASHVSVTALVGDLVWRLSAFRNGPSARTSVTRHAPGFAGPRSAVPPSPKVQERTARRPVENRDGLAASVAGMIRGMRAKGMEATAELVAERFRIDIEDAHWCVWAASRPEEGVT